MKEKKNINTNWAKLTHEQKVNIEISLQQLNQGKGIPIKKQWRCLQRNMAFPKSLNKI